MITKNYILAILLLLLSPLVLAGECLTASLTGNLNSNLEQLNYSTVDDSQIITAEDIKFCPGQSLKNANITPEELPDNGAVWRVGNRRWNDDFEKKYQTWVKKNLTPTLFEELNLATDCADAAIAVRAIFARIYNLPVNFAGNRYKSSSKKYKSTTTVKNWSKENWKEDFQKDKRFQASLKEWMIGSGTVNIHNDTYPIKVYDDDFQGVSSCVSAGAVFLSEGHAEILTLNEESYLPFRLLSSTVPSAVRKLSEGVFSFYDPTEMSSTQRPDRGLLWWNWTINCKGSFIKVKDKDMPYYSDQQHNTDWSNVTFPSVNDLFLQNLNLSDEQIQERKDVEIKFLLESLETNIKERERLVDESITICTLQGIDSAEDCYYQSAREKEPATGRFVTLRIDPINGGLDCEGCSDWQVSETDGEYYPSQDINSFDYHGSFFKPKSANLEKLYYEHSTPSRDKRLREKYGLYRNILWSLPWEQQNKLKLHLLDKKMLVDGKEISYYHILNAANNFVLSPQPWDSKNKRWGLGYVDHRKREIIKELNNNQSYKEYKQNKDKLSTSVENLSEVDKLNIQINIESFEKSNVFLLKEIEVLEIDENR